MRLRPLGLSTVLLLMSTPAYAESVGVFGWTYDALFGTGSTFSVSNESADPMEDVFVDLFRPDENDPFQSLTLGNVLGGESSQSIDDLSLFIVPVDLSRATLRLSFAGSQIISTLLAESLVGDPLDFLAGSVDIFASQDPTPQPVPEPATLLLLGSGVTVLTARRLRALSNRRCQSPGIGATASRNL